MAPVVCDQDRHEGRGRIMGRGSSRTRRLAVTLGVNIALAAGQLVAGVVAHSSGLLADAGHNITDVAGLTMSLVAVRWALRPRSREHSFGYHRGTILAALGNAAIIAAVTAAMVSVPGVAEVHDLHVWSISSEVRALSAHVMVVGHPSLEEAQAIGDQVKAAVAAPFTIAHTTLELECE